MLTRPVGNTQQDMHDKSAIKELIEFERFCRDNALWEEMKKCYAQDSKVIISWFQGTGHEFVEASSKMKGRAPHKIYNTQIWLANGKAVAIMLVTIQIRIILNGFPVELMSDAKLVFCTEKIDGLWYIVSMEGIYEKDSLVPVFPNSNINLPLDDLAEYRESYACLSYTLNREGYDVDSNLPGIDRPDLVEKLYENAKAWLYKSL
ncbi:bile acid 7-alpha dehydratase [Propionispora hippei]|uniref:SnoaL-like domain-containing protein n=1 Tax=Propionispora hippei DSM 15287 TaxID=1123003 RepID=A0A1M6DRT3_9FIRM|nr:bile acid 7-alpha dehydratase [Propionispora hippei]SHI75957.1 hypothetical protein SAMN02745170_00980 [Propionispora hippei DSM 15287]